MTTTPETIRNFFSLPLQEARKIAGEVIIVSAPLSETQGKECIACDGTGKCPDCEGEGNHEHICSCELCELEFEDCETCEGTGKCHECDGTGIDIP